MSDAFVVVLESIRVMVCASIRMYYSSSSYVTQQCSALTWADTRGPGACDAAADIRTPQRGWLYVRHEATA
jgi:hypothetical protein